MTRTEWMAAEKKVDEDFTGSLWEQLGYENKLCPTCGAHLHGGICLNACHLGDAGQDRFAKHMSDAMGSKR